MRAFQFPVWWPLDARRKRCSQDVVCRGRVDERAGWGDLIDPLRRLSYAVWQPQRQDAQDGAFEATCGAVWIWQGVVPRGFTPVAQPSFWRGTGMSLRAWPIPMAIGAPPCTGQQGALPLVEVLGRKLLTCVSERATAEQTLANLRQFHRSLPGGPRSAWGAQIQCQEVALGTASALECFYRVQAASLGLPCMPLPPRHLVGSAN